MFGLFKKGPIDSKQRLSLIEAELLKKGQVISKKVIIDLQYCNRGFNSIDKEMYPSIISTMLTLRLGFGILALNIGTRKLENQRELIYDTFSEWETRISENSIRFSQLLTEEVQKNISERFVYIHSGLQYELYGDSTLQRLKNIDIYFENSFIEVAEFYTDFHNLGSNKKFITYTRNQFLDSFSYFDRLFSNYKHI